MVSSSTTKCLEALLVKKSGHIDDDLFGIMGMTSGGCCLNAVLAMKLEACCLGQANAPLRYAENLPLRYCS